MNSALFLESELVINKVLLQVFYLKSTKKKDNMSSDRSLVNRVLTRTIVVGLLLAAMMYKNSNGLTLIRRFENKEILDIQREPIERRYTWDSSGINDLFVTALPRLEKLKTKIIVRSNNIGDEMYNKTLIDYTEKFNFGNGKQLTITDYELQSSKIMCETLAIGSNLPVPDPQEYKPFSILLLENSE